MTSTAAEAPLEAPETEPEPVETPESPGEPETTPEPGPEPEGPDEPGEAAPQGISEKQLDQAMQKLDREAKRHRDRISEIMGDEAIHLVPCVLCSPEFAGWRFNVPLRDEEKDLLLTLADPTRAQEFQPASHARECDGCLGLGLVVSGSRVANRELIPCAKCNGAGYVNVQGATLAALPPPEAVESAPIGTAPEEPLPDLDPFGRPPTDPNYGRLPQFVR